MYSHAHTKEGEFPRTARELLHHSLGLLVEQFPERVVDRRFDGEWVRGVPAYTWPGAGSERGGSAEHMRYEQIVFLPEKDGRVFLIGVGDKQFDSMHTVFLMDEDRDLSECDTRSGGIPSYYSVLFRYSVSARFADALLAYYHGHVQGKEDKNYTFAIPFDDVLEHGTDHFVGCPLFAADPGENSFYEGKILVNRAGVIVPSLSSPFVAVPAFWRDHLRDDRVERRVKLSRTLASYLQGEEVDPAFLNRDLEHAFRNERRMWKGESLPLNAYYPQMEEQALARLAANS